MVSRFYHIPAVGIGLTTPKSPPIFDRLTGNSFAGNPCTFALINAVAGCRLGPGSADLKGTAARGAGTAGGENNGFAATTTEVAVRWGAPAAALGGDVAIGVNEPTLGRS
jgi:hypothetical protein